MVVNADPGNRIHRRERLVQQQQGRRQHHGAAEGDALLLAPAQFVGVAGGERGIQIHQLEQLPEPGSPTLRLPGLEACQQRDVGLHVQIREQRRALYCVADPAPQGDPVRDRDPLTQGQDRALVRTDQAVDHLQER